MPLPPLSPYLVLSPPLPSPSLQMGNLALCHARASILQSHRLPIAPIASLPSLSTTISSSAAFVTGGVSLLEARSAVSVPACLSADKWRLAQRLRAQLPEGRPGFCVSRWQQRQRTKRRKQQVHVGRLWGQWGGQAVWAEVNGFAPSNCVVDCLYGTSTLCP